MLELLEKDYGRNKVMKENPYHQTLEWPQHLAWQQGKIVGLEESTKMIEEFAQSVKEEE